LALAAVPQNGFFEAARVAGCCSAQLKGVMAVSLNGAATSVGARTAYADARDAVIDAEEEAPPPQPATKAPTSVLAAATCQRGTTLQLDNDIRTAFFKPAF
jgi:hypothetical protein